MKLADELIKEYGVPNNKQYAFKSALKIIDRNCCRMQSKICKALTEAGVSEATANETICNMEITLSLEELQALWDKQFEELKTDNRGHFRGDFNVPTAISIYEYIESFSPEDQADIFAACWDFVARESQEFALKQAALKAEGPATNEFDV